MQFENLQPLEKPCLPNRRINSSIPHHRMFKRLSACAVSFECSHEFHFDVGGPVKLETGMEGKGDSDKFLDNGPNPTKPDKKEEVATGSEN